MSKKAAKNTFVNAPFPSIDFQVQTAEADKQRSACLIVGVYEDGKLSPSAKALDAASNSALSHVIASGDFTGKSGSTVVLYGVPGTQSERLLMVGLGDKKEYSAEAYLKATTAAANEVAKFAVKDVTSFLTTVTPEDKTTQWCVQQAVIASGAALYQYDATKSKKAEKCKLKKWLFALDVDTNSTECEAALAQGLAIAKGVKLSKDLANLPGNICTPTYLAEQAKAIAKGKAKVKAEILDESDLERLGMGSFLSVARGSLEPAKLIILHYNGGKKGDAPQVLVGKGLTFDAGGISLKPGLGMDEMKYDMCGGASVLGTLQAAIELELPINIIGVVPSTENMVDGFANKPGDIVTSMSGQTIEILNTDAEGRLILCDALTYVERFKPAAVIDIATLTGACVVALGRHASGLFTNKPELANSIDQAGKTVNDRCWELPLWDDYQSQLDSNFADMQNIGGKEAGTVTAACFLSRFTKAYSWAHLDIAGTAWVSGKAKGATGRPVPLLTQYLIDVADESS